MAQRVLSISLGSEVVKVCEVALAGKNKVQIFNAIDLVIPEGLCEDGVIYDAEGLASAINEGLNGEGFTAKKVVFSITSKRIASKEAIIPYCKENRIKDIVNINSPEYFPISNLEDYIVSYSILDVVTNEGVKNYRLSVVATPKELLSGYYTLASLMKMPVVHVDYSGNSILQLLKLQITGNEVDAIVQMGSDSSVISIMHGKTMVIQRSVPYGRNVIFEAVRDSQNLTDYEAEQVLADEDIVNLANRYPDVAEVVRTLFSSINRILEFYSSRNQEMPITNVYMIGDVSSINGLVDLFNNEWDFEVSLLGRIHGIEIKNRNNVNEEIASNYLANIGAMLAPMNLRIEEIKEGKKKANGLPWWILILSAIVSAAMIGAILFVYFTGKGEVDSIQAQIDALGDVVDLQSEYNTAQQELETLQNWYETTKSPNESLARLINDLESVQPTELAIKSFTLSQGALTLTGESPTKAAVAEFVKQLKNLDYVSDVRVTYISETVKDFNLSDAFTISLMLKYKDPNASEDDIDTELENDAVTDDVNLNEESGAIVVENIDENVMAGNEEVAE